MTEEDKVLISIPYISTDKNIDKLEKLYRKRAGERVAILLTEDTNRKHFFKIQNEIFEAYKDQFDWFVYSASDYFPGKNFIAHALLTAKCTGKKFIAFNDGKWDGDSATVGMIHKDLVPDLYDTNTLFHTGYKQHYGDTDLSVRGKLLVEYAYSPMALLVEVDYNKDLNALRVNLNDKALFDKRRKLSFPK